eukprot:PhF_6_TR2165/c0_g1_i6/m.3534
MSWSEPNVSKNTIKFVTTLKEVFAPAEKFRDKTIPQLLTENPWNTAKFVGRGIFKLFTTPTGWYIMGPYFAAFCFKTYYGPLVWLAALAASVAQIALLRRKIASRVRGELLPSPNVLREQAVYQANLDEANLKLFQTLLSDTPYEVQPREGYCGHATAINILLMCQKYCGRTFPLPELPGRPQPLDLPHLEVIMRETIPNDVVASIEIIPSTSPSFTYERFCELVRETNTKRTLLGANFLCKPLYYGNAKTNFFETYFGGHHSVITGCVKGLDGTEYVVLHDVNKDHGKILIPMDVMFRAVNTVNVLLGTPRGLLSVKLK